MNLEAQPGHCDGSTEETKESLLKAQAVLQQQATEALLGEGTLVSQATHTDAQHLQVLVLEAYAKRSEKLLQLLAEFHRRINLRVAHADRMYTAMTAANTSQGAHALHKLLPTASASLSRQIKSSLSKQADKIASLPALHHDADTAATVSQLSQQPAQLVLQAVADGSMHAAEEVHAITDALDLQIEANKVQMSSTPDIQGIEGILRAKQESHVKQFLHTEAALQAGHAAQQQIQALSADVQRQTTMYEQLIAARREVAGAKAVIAVVEAQLAGLQRESADCSNAKAELLHKWDQIREQAAFDQLVLHQLPRQSVSGDSKAPCAQLTLHRWQQAVQDAPAPHSTASANASQATTDGLLGILQHAAWQHPAALVQSPDVLLERVIELSCKKQQHMVARSHWNDTLADAEAAAAASAHRSARLQHAAAQTFHRSKDEDIPCLEAVVQSCQSATAFAEKEVKDAVTEWWTQPAVHAVPWVQYKGKNAAEWLMNMRAKHAAVSQC
ncbi:hypothetical protein WJX79_009494 [Trebouxia sp. C0005]